MPVQGCTLPFLLWFDESSKVGRRAWDSTTGDTNKLNKKSDVSSWRNKQSVLNIILCSFVCNSAVRFQIKWTCRVKHGSLSENDG